MTISFTKMHGLGNDFMVINAIDTPFNPDKSLIQQLANRHTGIGFDQCLIIEKSHSSGIDFYYRIFNASGDEVGQCGNGARCLMRYVFEKKLTRKKDITVKTCTTKMSLHLGHDNRVTLNMGIPKLAPNDIPMLYLEQKPYYTLNLEGHTPINFHAVNMGNPHVVIKVEDIKKAPVETLGDIICHHPLFPEFTNVGFMMHHDDNTLSLRVFERGVGETLACGSGAAAAAAISRLYYQFEPNISVHLPGGTLFINWIEQDSPLYLTGTATFVYDGVLFHGDTYLD